MVSPRKGFAHSNQSHIKYGFCSILKVWHDLINDKVMFVYEKKQSPREFQIIQLECNNGLKFNSINSIYEHEHLKNSEKKLFTSTQ